MSRSQTRDDNDDLDIEDAIGPTHDVTDPMAPLGWQCGDPACEWHGLDRFFPGRAGGTDG